MMMGLPKRVDDGVGGSTLGTRTREGRSKPGKGDVVTAEQSSEHEEKREVTRTRLRGRSGNDESEEERSEKRRS